MKTQYIILLLVLSYCRVQAATVDTAQLLVKYEFKHMQDSLNETSFKTETYILQIGQNASIYYSETARRMEAVFQKGYQAGVKVSDRPASLQNARKYVTTLTIYKKQDNAIISNYEVVAGSEYAYEEKMPQIQWVISNETKMIKEQNCQKATGAFRGRTYEVWFATALPFQNGPWKLGGLPGLILEAKDIKNQVFFTCIGIEKNSNADPFVIEEKKAVTKVERKEVERLKQLVKENPNALRKGDAASGSVKAFEDEIKSKTQAAGTSRIVFNNPLELIMETP